MPHTESTPKPLLQVTPDKKIIDYVLEALPKEIDRVIVVVDHLKEQVQSYIHEKNLKKELIFVEQVEMKGTYGALYSAKPHIKSERFLVLNGDDVLSKVGLEKMLQAGRSLGYKKRIMPAYYAVQSDKENNFLGFRSQTEDEKDNGANIATGTYVLDMEIFNFEPVGINGNEFGLPQMLTPHLLNYPLKTVEMPAWHPVNTIENLEALREMHK